ncbi:winged helix-turn-helix domain-containing protein [Halorientalis persicus]|uniref:winged helix-turn-helix domain-containing protein n=1 Tax=Halorientalis persicus TaxID=1367881 RepID=UPI000B8455F4|nr:winged helix-turn-helix domain-containing protein [Halorientalis persicus]
MAGRKPSVSDVEILREMAISPDPVLTAVELAERIDMSQQGAHSRLESLEDQQYVRSKKAGSRARVWWITDRGRQQLAELD